MMRNWLIVTPTIPGVMDSAPEMETAEGKENEYKPDSSADAPDNADYDNDVPQQPVEDYEKSGVFSESPDSPDPIDAEGGSADEGYRENSSTEENDQNEDTRAETTDTGNGSGGDGEPAETESETQAKPETETEPSSENGNEPGTELESETQTESESELETETETELESETESESQTETESETQTETESETQDKTGSNSELTGQGLETYILNLLEAGENVELETEAAILHEDLIQIHEDLQVTCCFIIVFLIILLCHYIYRFLKIFF